MNRTECLEEAKIIINGARQENYGKPESNFNTIADLWTAYFGAGFTGVDVAVMMLLVKVARLANKPDHIDSWIDICGYAANGCELAVNDE